MLRRAFQAYHRIDGTVRRALRPNKGTEVSETVGAAQGRDFNDVGEEAKTEAPGTKRSLEEALYSFAQGSAHRHILASVARAPETYRWAAMLSGQVA